MAYYHAELKALRDNLRAHNVHRLDGIADTSPNHMARVASIKGAGTDRRRRRAASAPRQ